MDWNGTTLRREELGAGLAAVWACGMGMLGLAGLAWRAWRRARLAVAEQARERRLREEMEAYARLDTTPGKSVSGGSERVPAAKALASRVCRTVAEKSAFTRVLMLLRNAEGSLRAVAWVGVDDLTVAAVERWGEQVVREERSGAAPLGRNGTRGVPIQLGGWQSFDREVGSWEMSGRRERRKWRRAIVVPIRMQSRSGGQGGRKTGDGRLAGAIVLCADGLAARAAEGGAPLRIEGLLSGVESLAARIGTAMEAQALSERLQRAEKLAGLGQLASGVAHSLNNPLTAVLGYAELIAESSGETRVQEDARTIVTEALKMKEIVQRLSDFWRPVRQLDELVDVLGVVESVIKAAETRLRKQGIKVELLAHGGMIGPVHGSRQRLRQVAEQLLENAAESIAGLLPAEEGESHGIRVSVSADEQTVCVIVSDTGPGFEEPGRVFDPFYTTRDPAEGAGLGLSICFGIVREHGGEIAAFNLHPHGAAVVVELPLGAALKAPAVCEDEARAEEPKGDRIGLV
jgi:signal transduction histidine kinase